MTRFITDFSTTHKTAVPTPTTAPIKAEAVLEDGVIITASPTPPSLDRQAAYGRLQDMADQALRDRPLPLISKEDLQNTFPKATTVRGL
ncbi:MAG: hypothetical protein LBC90_05330, partial [Candidatus Adiutrix sp.]|nr:hypothetical protein [Candidatus Adiutrix sp.]